LQRADWQKSSTRQQRYPEEFSDFARWRYEEPALDSHRFGLTVSDVDQVFFHDDAEANEAYILLLEVKTHGKKEIELHEENIYNLLDAVFRQASSKLLPVRLWGQTEQRKIKYMGWHLLVLSHTRPDNSEWMLWDNKHYINKDQLVKILRFESAPDTLEETLIVKATELERLKTNWKQVIGQAPEDTRRTPVAAILASAGIKPVAIEHDTIVLASRYPIHKQLIEKAANREIAEKIMSSFLGYPCHIRCVYQPDEYRHLVKAALEMGAQIIDIEEK